jgi:hypothetical protein
VFLGQGACGHEEKSQFLMSNSDENHFSALNISFISNRQNSNPNVNKCTVSAQIYRHRKIAMHHAPYLRVQKKK